jgi:hypothetical protein
MQSDSEKWRQLLAEARRGHLGWGLEMNLDFYLSEMSVSDRHGGGITLQRILGDDLSHITRFVHPHRFALDLPPIPSVHAKSDFFVNLFQRDVMRRCIGSGRSQWMFYQPLVQEWHARRIAARLNLAFPPGEPLKALISPQYTLCMAVLEFLRRLRPVEYITWVMDDHLVRYRDHRWYYPKRARSVLKKHLREASTVFVISPVLGDFYQNEFGVGSEVLFGPGDPVGEPIWESPVQDDICRIGYFGSLGAWQMDAVVRFANALPPGKAQLDIYTSAEELPPQLRLPAVKLKGMLAKEAVLARMRDYDAVLLPLSFEDSQRHLSEFNIATKMSECLASGTLTIIYGPSYAAMVRLLLPTGAACVLTDDSLADLPEVIRHLKDPGYRRKVLGTALELVRKEFSTPVMRHRWRAALAKLAQPAE